LHVYVAARHVERSDAISAYVEEHLIEPIRSHTGLGITRVEVQLFADGEKGNHFGCHVRVAVKRQPDINVREIEQSLYAAIDLAKDRVLRSLTEARDQMLTLRRHPKKYSLARLGRALGWLRRGRR
jgi:ribosome-associated translation inhibitor RaiA